MPNPSSTPPDPAHRLPDLVGEALDLPADARDDFLEHACAGDAALLAEARSLLDHDGADGFLEMPIGALAHDALGPRDGGELAPGALLGECEIVRFLGQGGMGEVYLARDTRLERPVAVKLLKRSPDDDALLHRFRHERKVLAGLTHPNIARLYGGGTTPEGRPYLVMECVEGERLDRFCETRGLKIGERLTLFRKVCAAVAYAHQSLVVHRDLKPANIRVTPEGEPKLLDFGIAKLLDPETATAGFEATVTLQGALTPGYASPEQIKGEAITTASDVYSLGVVLYELLTGQRPHAADGRRPDELARAVCEQEPARPSTVAGRNAPTGSVTLFGGETPARRRRLLEGDLDNIVAKALRKEPARRYPSVLALSEDIRRHLEGQPVTARKETLHYVGAKFITRHKALTAAAALVLLTLVGGIIATTWQAHRADEQRRRADRRFEDVRRLADSLMGEIHDSVQTLAGSTPTRKLIVARALEYLDGLGKEADTPALRLDLAAAYEKIGTVQGNPYSANLGDTEGASASYAKAKTLLQSLAGSGVAPGVEVSMALGRIDRALGDIAEVKGDYPATVRAYRQSLDTFARLGRERPSDPAVIDELSRAYETLGQGLARTENGKTEPVRCFEQSLVYRQKLIAQSPNNAKNRRGAAILGLELGELTLNDPSRGVSAIERAVAGMKALSDENPDNARARREYALGLFKLGWAQGEVGDKEGSLLNLEKCLALREQIAATDSKDIQAQYDLAATHSNLAEALTNVGQPEKALDHSRQAVASIEGLMAADPSNAMYIRNDGLFYKNAGNAHAAVASRESLDVAARLAHWGEAQTTYEKAQKLFADLSTRGPLRTEDSNMLKELAAYIAKCQESAAQLKK